MALGRLTLLFLCFAIYINAVTFNLDTSYWRPSTATTEKVDASSIGFFRIVSELTLEAWTTITNVNDNDQTTVAETNGNLNTGVNSDTWTISTSANTMWVPNTSCSITGIEAKIYASTNGNTDYHQIINATISKVSGSLSAAQTSVTFNRNYGYLTLGGATNLWGTTWTCADFYTANAPVLRFNTIKATGGNRRSQIGDVQLRVLYNFDTKVTSIDPPSVQAGNVTVTGTNFVNLGNVRCRFGTSLSYGTVLSNTKITCPIPQGGGYGSVSFAVLLDGSTATTESVSFTYTCDPNTCNGHGVCSYTGLPCNCTAGWTGNDCSTPVCTSVADCSNHGTCIAPATCECTNGWSGNDCATPICTARNDCSGHGVCVSPNTCNCTTGYYGASCDTADCSAQNNCNVDNLGGTCTSPGTCQCNSGFTGTSCEATCTTPCVNHAYCATTDNCVCQVGWTGPYCNQTFTCAGVNECSGHGTCKGQDQCKCDIGWLGNDCSEADCIAVNNCTGHGVCVSPYTCQCASGWGYGDCSAPTCELLNNCNVLNGGGSCTSPNVCQCNAGWNVLLNCSVPKCTGCGPNEECTSPGVCTCKSGFQPPNCTAILPTCGTLSDCNGHGTCTGQEVCKCNNGYLLPDCLFPDCGMLKNCSDNGYCVGPNQCSCFENYTNADCGAFGSSGDLIIEPPAAKKTDVALIAGIVGGLGGLLLILCVIFAIFAIRRYRHKQRFMFHEPAYNPIVFGKQLQVQYEWVGDSSIHDRLTELLLKPGMELVQAIVNVSPVTDKDNVAKALVHFFCYHKRFLPLMLHLIDNEVTICKSDTTLFRNNSLPIALFQVFSKIVGIRYLWTALGTLLNELNEISKDSESNGGSKQTTQMSLLGSELNLEIDPSKLEDESEYTINKYTLFLTCQKLFNSINQPDIVPLPIKVILHHVSRSVEKRFPDYTYKAIGGFLFLRFVVPSISAPHIYGLFTEPPNDATQRKLVILAKVLQNLANEVQFGAKEQYMSNLNDFLVQNLPALHQFFDEISTNTDSYSEEYEIPENVRKNAVYFLHGFIEQHKAKLIAELSTIDEATSQQFQSILKDLAGNTPVAKRD